MKAHIPKSLCKSLQCHWCITQTRPPGLYITVFGIWTKIIPKWQLFFFFFLPKTSHRIATWPHPNIKENYYTYWPYICHDKSLNNIKVTLELASEKHNMNRPITQTSLAGVCIIISAVPVIRDITALSFHYCSIRFCATPHQGIWSLMITLVRLHKLGSCVLQNNFQCFSLSLRATFKKCVK